MISSWSISENIIRNIQYTLERRYPSDTKGICK